MKAIAYTTAVLSLALCAGFAQAEDVVVTKSPDCPAAGTVAEADIPENCKTAKSNSPNDQEQTDQKAAQDGTAAPSGDANSGGDAGADGTKGTSQ